jgi:DNA processing protein
MFSDEADYPTLLQEIHDPPFALYILGELPNTKSNVHSVTVVGTRRATPDGKAITRRFARELANAGLTIVSGLALGIDAEAHEGCLAASDANTHTAGKTIAVLARGVDRIYPAENELLARRILEHGGGIISEYPAGEPPYPDRFLERNRIVSGLSEGVLVVEAPARSGSLATATFALEQDRNVFVVPGSITHPNFFGSHQLIRQGAELVTAPEEILEAYGIDKKEKTAKTKREEQNATPEEKHILTALRDANTPLEVDKIIALTKLEPRAVNRAITFLLIKQLIKEMDTGYIIE